MRFAFLTLYLCAHAGEFCCEGKKCSFERKEIIMAYRAIEEIGLLFNVKDGMVEAQADFMEIPGYSSGRFIEDFNGDIIKMMMEKLRRGQF